jgi:hypothetical protein
MLSIVSTHPSAVQQSLFVNKEVVKSQIQPPHEVHVQSHYKLDRLIVLSESSLLGWFLQVSLIVIIKGRPPMEVSLIVIILQDFHRR